MGVHHGGKLCYSLANLSFGQVDSVARKRAEEAGRNGAPAVAFDISWLCYRCHGIEDVMAMISIFLDNGFLVYPVFDPEWRHHTKKASIAREFKRRLAYVEGIRAKAELMVVSRKLRQENLNKRQHG